MPAFTVTPSVNLTPHNDSSQNSSPKQRYRTLVTKQQLSFDPAQQVALDALDELYIQLSQKRRQKQVIKGLYLWGKVGRGKTFLMDLFCGSLNDRSYLRLHFHHFMAGIHKQLRELEGRSNPLKHIAYQISSQYKVLCFDEFFVSDIGDAMLLGNLFHYLFTYQVTLVSTSNTAPERLYWDGLQRARFLPAIKAIEDNTRIIHLDGEQDHRERALTHKQIFFVDSHAHIEPEKQAYGHSPTQQLLEQLHLASAHATQRQESHNILRVLGREIPYISKQYQHICFAFHHLCEGPRSHLDYIDIAHRFSTVVILGIPPLSGQAFERIKARGTEDGSIGSGETGERAIVLAPSDDAMRRFIAVVDEFYERNVKLYLTSCLPLHALYTEGSLLFEFERTRSRLTEMASQEYLSLPHKP